MFLFLVMLGCTPEPVPEPELEILASCGNGVVEPDEQCDDGEANSDTLSDACRTSCRTPICGDGVADGEEDCDDGNTMGGDGCSPLCQSETNALEQEPNDTWDAAQSVDSTWVTGSLGSGDIDCFSVEVEECETVLAELGGECAAPIVLALHSPDGTQVASSGFNERGCAVVDPVEEPGARFATGGPWAVCASALVDEEVSNYALRLISAPSESFNLPLSDSSDFDGDGLIDACDSDRDGDGVLNQDDNCPDIPNGSENPPQFVDSSGFVRHWLSLGPFTGHKSTDTCLPTEVERLGVDAEAVPVLGEVVEDASWRVFLAESYHVDFVPSYATVDAPREIYLASWVFSPVERVLTLGHGPDDGALVWLNGELVQEVASCQGVVVDKFESEVTLIAGWNRLLVKVYDQGGGWGTTLRFLENGDPVTDLEVSLTDGMSWDFDQSDSDGDGLGDACDFD